MAPIIGIDLGTTNSVVAVMEGQEARVIPNAEGSRTTPSVVAWPERGEVLVGEVARRQAITNPGRTVFSIKRLMGRPCSPPDGPGLPYEVVPGPHGQAAVQIGERRWTPPEISARVLMKLKGQAEAYLGQEVTEAVITVPAYFNDAQRQATRDAGRVAGLQVRRLVNEPTAAALAYQLEAQRDRLVAVYDLGGGTFDLSLLEMGQGVVEVKATAGDTHLGGDDIDQLLIEHLLEAFAQAHRVDLGQDKVALQRLKDAAEKAKIELSSTLETEVHLPFLGANEQGPCHLQHKISRARLESLIEPLVQRSLERCQAALDDAALRPEQVDEVILVGGSTRVPLVQRRVEAFFGRPARSRLNPDEVVAMGAALQGSILAGEVRDLLLLDVTSLSLGVEIRGGLMTRLIERNTTIPTRASRTFTTAVDQQREVEVHVLQGEREFTRDNHSLGRFSLEEIPPAPRGEPRIEVTFDIDANGMVHVSAVERSTGRSQRITVEPDGSLSEAQIQRMLQEARQSEASDRRKRHLIEARNRLDALVIAARAQLHQEDAHPHSAQAPRRALERALLQAQERLGDHQLTLEAAQGSQRQLREAIVAFAAAIATPEPGEPAPEGAAEEAAPPPPPPGARGALEEEVSSLTEDEVEAGFFLEGEEEPGAEDTDAAV